MHEELFESGLVMSVSDGEAQIDVTEQGDCEACGAKAFCKPGEEKKKLLTVKDPIGVKPGDKVKISVKGEALFKASLMLYGAPLILLILGIFLGMEIFGGNEIAEFYAFLIGAGFMAVYFGILYFFGKSIKQNNALPVIVQVYYNETSDV